MHLHRRPLFTPQHRLQRRRMQRMPVCSAVPIQRQRQHQQRWRSLCDITWEGDERAALQPDALLSAQHPLWRLLLLSDGSVTRHLQLLTGSAVEVDCLAMDPVSPDDDGLPPAVTALPHPLLQREVLLRNLDDGGRALVHATSWWNTDAASSNLRDPSQPIWVSLSQARKELYREIQTVQLGGSAALEEHFGASGPFWGRQYLFWHGGQPLTLIHEVFSPHIAQYLGQSSSNGSHLERS